MSEFNVLVNDVAAPAVYSLPSTIKDTVTFTLVAKDGAAGHGRLVSIDTDGALVPTQSPLQGQLDSTGQFKFTIGPGNVYGAFLRGNISLDISVANKTKSQGIKLV